MGRTVVMTSGVHERIGDLPLVEKAVTSQLAWSPVRTAGYSAT